MTEASRTSDNQNKKIDMQDPADIQRGYARKPSFYFDVSLSEGFSSFMGAVQAATDHSGWATSYSDKISDAQFNLIDSIASSISSNMSITHDAVRDFLIILCCIDKQSDMDKIAEAVGLESLANPEILGKPDLILQVDDIYKIAFVANAVDGILKVFSRYLQAQSTLNSTGTDISSIISQIGGVLGSVGVSLRVEAPESLNSIGQFMSELLTGKRIPMNVIAKNPNLQSPSYVGQAFMGESPIAISNVDITQIFAKKIATFPMMQNGSGSTMFSIQNAGSLGGSMTIDGLVGKMMFGSSSALSSIKQLAVNTALDKLKTLTGVNVGEIIQVTKADTAIPLLAALSAVQSGTDTPLISTSTFQGGWSLANAVSNHLMKVDPNYMALYKAIT